MDPALSPKKKPKLNEHEEAEQEPEDRLSSLPDSVIHYILSFIDIKYAVQMSRVSPRYRHLWKSLPALNFDSKLFRRLTSFDKFVNRVNLRRDCRSAAVTITYRRRGITDIQRLKNLVYAMQHGIRHLSISAAESLRFRNHMYLPNDLFDDNRQLGWGFMREKTDSGKIYNEISLPFNWPVLTTLRLENVSFQTHDMLQFCVYKFKVGFSGCPNLKSLSLKHFDIGSLERFHLDIPQVLDLTLDLCYDSSILACACDVVVTAPKLVYFSFQANLPLRFFADNLASLEKVDFCGRVRCVFGQVRDEKLKVTSSDLINMLRQFSNAESVTLAHGVVMNAFMYVRIEGQLLLTHFNRDIALTIGVYAEIFSSPNLSSDRLPNLVPGMLHTKAMQLIVVPK
ncbi:hypothetical protein RJ640_024956 [Escallonia rubra]|uniref:F-box domain-containing protein n=1 Tax=Escallonia rubra TaxID=112253 RepID=A0AA88RMZ4_9ASTE|nr:hypothetical protein RJ640_024956 [Escallonia rubra]